MTKKEIKVRRFIESSGLLVTEDKNVLCGIKGDKAYFNAIINSKGKEVGITCFDAQKFNPLMFYSAIKEILL